MKYIAALDYEHLDNGIFLNAVGRALARQKETRSIIVHGDSKYTERLIQTGIMREEARIRCIKDLNHRLVALFADQGVSTIGLNGYRKKAITIQEGELKIDTGFFDRLPTQPVLLLSNLVLDTEKQKPVPVELGKYLKFLHNTLSPDEIFLFSKESDSNDLRSKESIPDEFRHFERTARLTTASAFAELPELKGSAKLDDLK